MSKRLKFMLAGLAGVVVLLVVAGAGVWYFVWRSDAPPQVSLAGAISSLASPAASPAVSPSPSASAAPDGRGEGPRGGGGGEFDVKAAPSVAAPSLPSSGGSSLSAGLAGTWSPDSSKQSFVGYRVEEELRAIGSNTVVGRTPGITGQAVLNGNTLTSASFVADVTKLKSDNGLRDGQLRRQGIEYEKFPTATFELSEPLQLPSGLAAGQPVSMTLKGKFTLHGVTKDVAIPTQAQVVSNNLVVVGTFPITFADYQIAKPRGGPVLSLADSATVELQIILAHS